MKVKQKFDKHNRILCQLENRFYSLFTPFDLNVDSVHLVYVVFLNSSLKLTSSKYDLGENSPISFFVVVFVLYKVHFNFLCSLVTYGQLRIWYYTIRNKGIQQLGDFPYVNIPSHLQWFNGNRLRMIFVRKPSLFG